MMDPWKIDVEKSIDMDTSSVNCGNGLNDTEESMEELKISDESAEKENSFEDLLGDQCLRISDTEEEEENNPKKHETNSKTNSSKTEDITASSLQDTKLSVQEEEKTNDASENKNHPVINKNVILSPGSKKPESLCIEDKNESLITRNKSRSNSPVENLKTGQINKISSTTDSDSEVNADVLLNIKRKNKSLKLEDSDSDDESIAVDKEKKTINKKQEENDKSSGEGMFNKDHYLKKSKISKIVDSDSEGDYEHEKSFKDASSNNSDSDIEQKKRKKNKVVKQRRGLIEKSNGPSKKISQLIDTDSEDDKRENNGEDRHYDTDSRNDHLNSTKEKKSKTKKQKQKSSSLENTADLATKESPTSETKGAELQPPNNNNSKKMRASAKVALEEIQTIQSEQQRLHREAHLNVPYHKSKRHTLQEFLKRRTIIKPGEESPVTLAVQKKSLKMNSEELEEYAQLMEERAKEATEFFKSESEEEDELKDNIYACDTGVAENAKPVEESELITNVADSNEVIDTEEQQNKDNIILRPTTPHAIITEVIELPKIDFSNMNIITDAVFPPISPSSSSTPIQQRLNTADNLKRLISENVLPESPTLKGDPDMLIDLETGGLIAKEESTGVKNLLQRLLKTKKPCKQKNSNTLSVLSTDNGKLEISKIKLNLSQDTDPNIAHKPGEAYFKLKENLKSIIQRKRLNEMQKKKEESSEYHKCVDDDEEAEDYEVEDDKAENDEVEDDDAEYESEKYDKEKIKYIEIDDEENVKYNDEEDLEGVNRIKNEEDIEDDDDDLSSVEADENNESCLEISDNEIVKEESKENFGEKRKSYRLIKAFSDESDDEVDLLKTQILEKAEEDIPAVTTTTLFELESQKCASDEENELLALCSGTFENTQATQSTQKTKPLISQIPITQRNDQQDGTDELLELCSGNFDNDENSTINNAVSSSVNATTRIISSDEEKESDSVKKNRAKKLSKKLKKNTPKLVFSEDEDEDDNSVNDENEGDNNDEESAEEEEEPETYVEYDSEENEIVVQLTKKDKIKHASNFVEKEAELSESEWGSADEDERNLDKYDIELGDEDEFDGEKIRTELGQIHARKVLDEDIREVRKLQEMFFEDEEKDGVGRQRQFKWKNAESGFSLDDTDRNKVDEEGNNDSEDEESEQVWRKIRFEREQVLKEEGLNRDSEEFMSTNTTFEKNTTLSTIKGAVKKINIVSANKSVAEEKKNFSFIIAKSTKTQKQTVRGSFLVRDNETLSKLAHLTKGATDEGVIATAKSGSVNSNKKNFVFTTITAEEHESLKRKAEDLLNKSDENGINFMKKPKLQPRREECHIDKLK